jgi:hemoglobin/transferrin/lactoferrin receptor protein
MIHISTAGRGIAETARNYLENPMLRHPLTHALLSLLAAGAAAANPLTTAAELDRVVVVGSKIPQLQAKVVNAVGQIDREALDRQQAQDIRDAFRYEPAVTTPGDGHRFGVGGFNIRGLDGNRVAVELDGVPIADAFKVGDLASAGRDVVDIEAVQKIEFLRGPASTLYGSDALAGVIAFTSRDPHDLVEQGSTWRLRSAWTGRDDGLRNSLLGAWAGGSHGLLALASERRSDELENNPGPGAPAANPAERRRSSGLLKYVYLAEGWKASALVDRSSSRNEIDVRSLVRGAGRFATTTALFADDQSERERLQFGLEGTPGGIVSDWQLRLYSQRSETEQRSLQTIMAVPPRTPAYFRDRLFAIDQRTDGGELTLHSRFDTGPLAHDLVYGVSLRRQRVEQFRTGLQTRLDTGETSNVILGEVLPVRDFPNSRTTQTALYLQDDIAIGDSPLSLLWGLRHERQRLDAEADALFAEDFSFVPADIRRSRTTPRLGLRFEPTAGLSLYALWAEGFRAPPYSDVNIALSLPTFNYEVRPNPLLRPERSRGTELGLDWRGDASAVRVALFRNRYRDLIESRANLGIDPVSGATVFQSVNRESARIDGIELAAEHRFGAGRWQANAALAALRGDDLRRDQPLASVPPPSAVLGLRRQADPGLFPSLELVVTAVRRRDRLDPNGPALFRAPGYATLDLLADWQFGSHLRLNAGLYNLADRRYWEWGQIAGQLAGSVPPIGFFTAPGRNAAVTVELRW